MKTALWVLSNVILIFLVVVASATFLWLVMDRMNDCTDAEDCIKKGQSVKEYFYNLPKAQTEDGKMYNCVMAKRMEKFFAKAKEYGADPGIELANASDTVEACCVKAFENEDLEQLNKFLNQSYEVPSKVAEKISKR